MTDKQIENLGIERYSDDEFFLETGEEVDFYFTIHKSDKLSDVLHKIARSAFKEGIKVGKFQKQIEIKRALDL